MYTNTNPMTRIENLFQESTLKNPLKPFAGLARLNQSAPMTEGLDQTATSTCEDSSVTRNVFEKFCKIIQLYIGMKQFQLGI
jgi:hypothetical protein